ncbi:Hypothetical protein HDN1F_34400 [gamma proteobacterium HdN1]|nr:Hypothetical protein HDN1F_34400 [gamma proteobacterium HdN1]
MAIDTTEGKPILGETSGIHSLNGAAEFHEAICALAGQARQSLKIFTQELDHDLYDYEELAELISELGRSAPNLPVRILIKSASKAAQKGHRLVELQRRLPSAMEFRSFPYENSEDMDEFLLADNVGLLKRYTHGAMRGYCEFRAIPEGPKALRYFDLAWDRAEPCHELRRLAT